MKKSVFIKIFAGYLLIICLLSSAFFIISFRIFKEFYTGILIEDLKKQAQTLLLTVQPLLEQKRIDQIDVLVKQVGKELKTRITVIDIRGTVLADSEKDPKTMENHRMRPEVIQALYGHPGSAVRYSSTVEEDMLYMAVPVYEGTAIKAVLRLSLFMHDINRLTDEVRKGILYIALLITGIALIISLIISRRFTNPIRELRFASKRIASGDFDVRVFLKSHDDFFEFADSFNTMTEKIRDLFMELSLQKEELKNIISSLHEGLLVIDHEGKIILCNESLQNILAPETINGKMYWEVIREPEFGELIRQVRQDKCNRIQEVSFGNRMMLCSTSFIKPNEEIVVVFLDITEMKNVERMKKDIVVNVSHELRTPLTAIKGFIETMDDEITDEHHRRYLNIIKRHTNRLINIVKDLMTLSKLEEEKKPDVESVDIKNLADQVSKIYEQKLKEKNLILTVTSDSRLIPVSADSFKLEQMFINLIDNAIKYTEQGGVKISLRQDDTNTIICIEDSGVGISHEHLTRIFERFYVVDKARSRKSDGTGLGLSIVKHIVLLHRGTIDVESTPGVGTKFTVKLPT